MVLPVVEARERLGLGAEEGIGLSGDLRGCAVGFAEPPHQACDAARLIPDIRMHQPGIYHIGMDAQGGIAVVEPFGET